MNVLVLNAGSSSLKFKLMRTGESQATLAEGVVEKWDSPQAALRLSVGNQPAQHRSVAAESRQQAAEHAVQACIPLGIDALGHRVVHGGARFEAPTLITNDVVEEINRVSHLAPLHNQLALAGIQAGLKLLPDKPAVAVFDTAFHRTMPDVAARYALPLKWAQEHELRRYGFHGISHQYVSGKLLQCMSRPAFGCRLITCHLGNGSSVCAIRDGKSVDTSMGLTPMEGLVMGTRSGDVDPGMVLHLLTGMQMTPQEVDNLLNRQSGLLGLSGISGDMRDVESAAGSGNIDAQAALESFAYRLRKYIGAYAAALAGLDAIAFTGGIGEHSWQTRQNTCRGLEFLGIKLDDKKNRSAGADATEISSTQSKVQVWMIPTDEERQIARETEEVILQMHRTT